MNKSLLPLAEAIKSETGRDFHRITIQRWRRQGKIKGCVKIGRQWFCTVEDIREMIKSDTENSLKGTSN